MGSLLRRKERAPSKLRSRISSGGESGPLPIAKGSPPVSEEIRAAARNRILNALRRKDSLTEAEQGLDLATTAQV